MAGRKGRCVEKVDSREWTKVGVVKRYVSPRPRTALHWIFWCVRTMGGRVGGVVDGLGDDIVVVL